MSKHSYPSDSFDQLATPSGRVGAHRAQRPGPGPWRVFAWAAVAVLVLTTIGILAIQTISGRIEWFPQDDVLPSVSFSPSAEESVIDTSAIVVVLNGSDQSGAEEQLRQKLLAAGWSSSHVLSAKSETPFDKTTVFYQSDADRAAAAGVAGLIGGAELVLDTSQGSAAASEAAVTELTVVIGADYGAQQAE